MLILGVRHNWTQIPLCSVILFFFDSVRVKKSSFCDAGFVILELFECRQLQNPRHSDILPSPPRALSGFPRFLKPNNVSNHTAPAANQDRLAETRMMSSILTSSLTYVVA